MTREGPVTAEEVEEYLGELRGSKARYAEQDLLRERNSLRDAIAEARMYLEMYRNDRTRTGFIWRALGILSASSELEAGCPNGTNHKIANHAITGAGETVRRYEIDEFCSRCGARMRGELE